MNKYERIWSNISKGECVLGGVLGKPGTRFRESSPSGVGWAVLNLRVISQWSRVGCTQFLQQQLSQHMGNVVQQGSLLDSVSKVFVRG